MRKKNSEDEWDLFWKILGHKLLKNDEQFAFIAYLAVPHCQTNSKWPIGVWWNNEQRNEYVENILVGGSEGVILKRIPQDALIIRVSLKRVLDLSRRLKII